MTKNRSTRTATRTAATALAALATVTGVALAAPAQAADPRVGGQIGARYEALGGSGGFLGQPVTGETRTPNQRGSYVHFQGGSIYASPATGAHEVHGLIRDEWAAHGWEAGVLGFPTTDETATPNRAGAYNHFQGGSVYWSPATGAHEVHGAIRATWASYGWEAGAFGFPVSDEYDVPGGKRADFQGGSMQWTAKDGVTVIGDSAVAGCPAPFNDATPEQAAGCLARGWEQRDDEVMATYAVNAVTGELRGTPYAPMTFDGCSHPAKPTAATSARVECVFHIPAAAGSGAAPHGVDLHLGIGIYDGSAVVEDVEFIG
ncbi:LGFP repeat-containing protein [Kineococcus radiotolerans]|uniref:LGFP repeat protein n=1 Tax=Kineococcus radiotolerans (strain ATCC BAA-149 / DSM 14245 / SRS30216) TaxID=266940 RepID=A6W9G2_KINRD|nr:LGFP repeat-containing protein [Kineococcus radiotolerans]ABS03451.1 LGFP repeat protein [Kineococcus radiotolerans SRS30216 = ATCC BAA-149]